MIFCPKCGTVLDEDDRFCTECGTDISIRPREGKSDNDIDETRFVPSETSLNFGHGTISGKNSWDSYPGMREGMLQYMISIVLSDKIIANNEVQLLYKFGNDIGLSKIEVANAIAQSIQRNYVPSLDAIC